MRSIQGILFFLLDKHERSFYFVGMAKGENTKLIVLEAGLDMASQLGLECVTIGNLAKTTNLSKSGLFAHFQSKENLQVEILNFAAQLFSEGVIFPALFRIDRGLHFCFCQCGFQ